MNTRSFLGASLAAVVGGLVAGAAGLGAGGCGEDVATCDTICGFSDAPTTCGSTCAAQDAACGTSVNAGDFQAYLTCVNNAGSYGSIEGLCEAEATAVARECGPAATPDPGGGTGSSSGSSPGGAVDAGVDTGTSTGVFTGPCALGNACTGQGTTCTNAGAGPCSSDQRLVCSDGVLVADGFPCSSSPETGCGFGSASSGGAPGCSETCSCVDGLEVCTGNCPDGGPASP